MAEITYAIDFSDIENPTIGYTNPDGASASVLQACISSSASAPYSDNVAAYRNISTDGGNYTFALTNTELANLWGLVPYNGTTASVSFVIKCTVDGVTAYDAKAVTFTMTEREETKPTLTLYAEAINPLTFPSSIENDFIVYKSLVGIGSTFSGKYGATLSNWTATIEGESGSDTEAPLYYETERAMVRTGSVPYAATAIDSRGFSTTVTSTITVHNYSAPQVAPASGETLVRVYRVDQNDDPDDDGQYIHIKAKKVYSSIGGDNDCTLRWRYQQSGSSPSSWYDLTTVDDEFDARVTSPQFSESASYSIDVGVIDSLGSQTFMRLGIPTADVTLHLADGGKAIGVGCYAEQESGTTVANQITVAYAAKFLAAVIAGTINATSVNAYSVDADIVAADTLNVGNTLTIQSLQDLLNIVFPTDSVFITTSFNGAPGSGWELENQITLSGAYGDTTVYLYKK